MYGRGENDGLAWSGLVDPGAWGYAAYCANRGVIARSGVLVIGISIEQIDDRNAHSRCVLAHCIDIFSCRHRLVSILAITKVSSGAVRRKRPPPIVGYTPFSKR